MSWGGGGGGGYRILLEGNYFYKQTHFIKTVNETIVEFLCTLDGDGAPAPSEQRTQLIAQLLGFRGRAVSLNDSFDLNGLILILLGRQWTENAVLTSIGLTVVIDFALDKTKTTL